MSIRKKILFLTGTRADFGKMKSLMLAVKAHTNYELLIFATGMHMDSRYGLTVNEIYKSGFNNVFTFKNYATTEHMDRTLGTTIKGFSEFVGQTNPDLIVVHGDRSEALAGAIVGSFNNILVAHIEGGEISGTIDELIRHSVSKMSHIHYVANQVAKKRLLQMGEIESSIYVIGSPDLDLMNPDKLPDIETVKKYYQIPFLEYGILMYHPVTTEIDLIKSQIQALVDAVIDSKKNYVVVFPNNDIGTDIILDEFKRFDNLNNFKVFPSLRFEYFLKLLEKSEFIIGNSSAGIREAPYYGIPTINIGSRQKNRSNSASIINIKGDYKSVIETLKEVNLKHFNKTFDFGKGDSANLFIKSLETNQLWSVNCQKQFVDIKK